MHNIITSLMNSGWDIEIICPGPSTESQESINHSSVTYHQFPYKDPQSNFEQIINSTRGAATFKHVISEHDIDIILDDVSHVPFYPAHFLSDSIENCVFMHTAFYNDVWEFEPLIKGVVVNLIDRTVPYLNKPRIVCASESTKRRIQHHSCNNDFNVLNPCIQISNFEYKFDPDCKSILYLGRLTRRKNVSSLIKAWSKLENIHSEYKLSIAGTGPQEQKLKELSRELNIENIEFHGYVTEQKKRELYRESLLFVVPSLIEGYLTTGLEALASGTPVIGSNTSGVRDYIKHEYNGFLFEPDNAVDLCKTLNQAIDDENNIENVARNGRKVAEEHSYNKFQQRADQLFRSFIN